MLGYILAVVILYKALIKDEESSCCENVTSSSDDNSDTSSNNSTSDGSDKSLDTKKGTSFKVKEGIGVLKLPSCNLVAVQLGPSEDKKKAVLTLYLESKTLPQETFKPVSVLKTKKYVKLSPTYYVTGITLESKGVPITAYYSSVL